MASWIDWGPDDQRSTAAEPVLLGSLGGRLYHSNCLTKVQWCEPAADLSWPGLRFHDLRATAIALWEFGPKCR